jgi:allophanate hydrolase subunit 2
MGGLRVVALAGAALYQDDGRRHLSSGLPTSGAFDQFAHAAATSLVGGSSADASLEITGTIVLQADVPLTCAVTGSAAVEVNGRWTAPWTALDVAPGGALEIRGTGRGYLAVAGGFDPPAVLGSRSTCLMGPIGPAPVRTGDVLPLTAMCTSRTAGDFVRPPSPRSAIRVIPGPHLHLVAGSAHVEDVSRIGVRLSGGRLREAASVRVDLPSLGVLPGAVQVLPTGQWMVLGPDAGTMGGYPVAGVVASADLQRLAHLVVGDILQVEVIATDQAEDLPVPTIVHVHALGG